MNKKEIEEHVLQNFEIIKFISSGAYGHVWKVKHRENKKQYALKKIFDAFQNDIDAQRTYRQIAILHQLDHQNIVQLHYVIRSYNDRDLYLVFEYVETDLHSVIGDNILGPSHIRYITYQICKVLKYLHSAQLIHRDLKTSNILINSNCEIKVCDFGLSRSIIYEQQAKLVLTEDVATRWYRSPQMILGCTKYGKPTDIWSLGCILAELIKREPIFPGTCTIDQLKKIFQFTGIQNLPQLQSEYATLISAELKFKKRPLKSYFDKCDKQTTQLILSMLHLNPTKRITAEQILELPCMQQFRGKTRQNVCKKFIISQVDDNIRLTLEEYRRLIYQDIQRRYPLFNRIVAIPRINRCHNSLKKTNQQILMKRGASNSLIKVQNRIKRSIHKSKYKDKEEDEQNKKMNNTIGTINYRKKKFHNINQKQLKQNQTPFIECDAKGFTTYTPQITYKDSKIIKRKLNSNIWVKHDQI